MTTPCGVLSLLNNPFMHSHRVPTSELVQGPSSADIITGTSADIGRASMQQPLPPPAQDLPSEPEDSGATGPMAGALARVRGTGRLGTGEADMTLPVTGAFGAEWAAGGDVDLAGASRPMAEQMTTLNAQQRALAEQWRMLVSSLSAARPKPAPPPPPPPQQQQVPPQQPQQTEWVYTIDRTEGGGGGRQHVQLSMGRVTRTISRHPLCSSTPSDSANT